MPQIMIKTELSLKLASFDSSRSTLYKTDKNYYFLKRFIVQTMNWYLTGNQWHNLWAELKTGFAIPLVFYIQYNISLYPSIRVLMDTFMYKKLRRVRTVIGRFFYLSKNWQLTGNGKFETSFNIIMIIGLVRSWALANIT